MRHVLCTCRVRAGLTSADRSSPPCFPSDILASVSCSHPSTRPPLTTFMRRRHCLRRLPSSRSLLSTRPPSTPSPASFTFRPSHSTATPSRFTSAACCAMLAKMYDRL